MNKKVLDKITELIKSGKIESQLFIDAAGATFEIGRTDWEYADNLAKEIYRVIAAEKRTATPEQKKLIHELQK